MEDKDIYVAKYQSVKDSLIDEYVCMLLSINKMTKEQRLMGLIMADADSNGMADINLPTKNHLCHVVGIDKNTYKFYISKWKKSGIIKTDGSELTFKKYLHKTAQCILITTNGMIKS